MTPSRWLLLAPSIVLAATVLLARLSGNDKAPFLVLTVLALLLLGLMVCLMVWLASGMGPHVSGRLAAGLLVPCAYAVLVLLLARAGLVDSQTWLGFR